jgi:amino acid adenylation domain-containing protein
MAGQATSATGEAAGQALSYNQMSMWLIHQEAPDSPAYNVAVSRHVPFELLAPVLGKALQKLVDRHPMLRTTYHIGADGLPVQRTADFAPVAFTVHEVPQLADDALRARLEADYRMPFDLQRGPVFRASLYTRGPADHVLLMVAHHIACDGLSSAILRDDLTPLYIEAAQLGDAPLPAPDRQYRDFVDWQHQLLEGPEGMRMAEGWLARLEGAPDFDVPGDRPRPAQKNYRGASVSATLDAALTAGLRRLARDHGVTLYVLLLAAFDAMLYRVTGKDDVLVGTPTAGRNLPGLARVVGNFVNPIPLRSRILEGMSFSALLQRVSEDVRDGLGRQDYPLPLLVRRLRRRRDAGHSPLYETFFTFLTEERDPAAAAADRYRLTPFPISQLEGQFDLAVQVIERGAILPVDLRYNPELFDAATASGLLAHYQALLAAVVQAPGLPLERLATSAGADDIDTLLATLGARGVRLTLDGESLRVHAPAGALDDGLKGELQRRKAGLVAALGGAGRLPPAVTARTQRDAALLSTRQQLLWWREQAHPGCSGNVAMLLQIHGALDAEALARAIDAVIVNHDGLRTVFRNADGQLRAELHATPGPTLRVVDLSTQPAAQRASDAMHLIESAHQQVFDLAQGPLASFLLMRLGGDAHQLLIRLHPLVADHAALEVVWYEIAAACRAITTQDHPASAAPGLQYSDYAAWQREGLQYGRFIQDLRYWMRELQDAPEALELPVDHPRPALLAPRPARYTAQLSPNLRERLAAFSGSHAASLETTLLAAWQVLLCRRTGQSEVVVGLPAALRDGTQARVIGPLENPVAVRGRLGDNPTFAQLLQRTAAAQRHALVHGSVPFERVVTALGIPVASNRHPVFQTMLAVRTRSAPWPAIAGLHIDASIEVDLPGAGMPLDLTLEIELDGAGLRLRYSYAAELFEPASIERLHGHYLALLEAIVDDATRPVRELSLLSRDEQQRLDSVNQTTVAIDRTTVVERFAAVAARHRDDMAATGSDGALSYGEFDARSSALAARLRAAGVGRGHFVALATDRSTALPLAALGIMKTGAAYLPLDLSYPAERVALMLDDSGARHVVTTAALRDSVPVRADTTVIVIDDLPAAASAPLDSAGQPRPDDIAYLIYTSGSTGKPKGVLVPHSALSNFLSAMTDALGFTAADRILAVTSPSFDISVLEMFVPLVNGGAVIMASRDEVSDGERLARRLTESGATLLQATPSGWRLLMQLGWRGDTKLQAIIGGEPLPPSLAAWLRPRVRTLWNAYGPTETTVWSTLARIDDDGPIAVGKPIANTRIYVIGADGRVVPPGEIGEIVIAGDGVTRGYHQRPELTAERFVAEPGHGDARMYHTGDLGRWREDGQLEHLGRLDDQVKLRGHRIELGEIEVRLGEHPAVAQAVLGVQIVSADDPRLVAWVRLRENAEATVSELRRHLRKLLPDYMVPSLIVPVDRIPLAPNGKIDRRALAQGTLERNASGSQGEAPSTPTQQLVAEVWKRLLGVPEVTLGSGFFDLGGHSLLAMRAAHEISQRIGRAVDPRLMFLRNLGQLAEGLESDAATREGAPVP